MSNDTRILVLVLFPIPPRPPSRPDLESLMELRRLAVDLRAEGIRLIPYPAGLPWHRYPPFGIEEFADLLGEGMFDWPDLDYWLRRSLRDWPESAERWWRYYPQYLPEVLHNIQRLIERRLVNGVVLLTSSGWREESMAHELQQVSELIRPSVFLHLEMGRPERTERPLFPGIRSLRYPESRDEVAAALRSLGYDRGEGAARQPSSQLARDVAPTPGPAEAPRKEKPDNVHLGASAPRVLSEGQEFVARFAAYTLSNREEVRRDVGSIRACLVAALSVSHRQEFKSARKPVRSMATCALIWE